MNPGRAVLLSFLVFFSCVPAGAEEVALTREEQNVVNGLGHGAEYVIPNREEEFAKLGRELYRKLSPASRDRVKSAIVKGVLTEAADLKRNYTGTFGEAISSLASVEPKFVAEQVLKLLPAKAKMNEWTVGVLYRAFAKTGDPRGPALIIPPLRKLLEEDGYPGVFQYLGALPSLAAVRYDDRALIADIEELGKIAKRKEGSSAREYITTALRAAERSADLAKFGPLSVKLIDDLRSKKNIQRLDDLIPELPKSFRRNVVLMTHSGSTQWASPAAPRIILYDRYLVVGFSGNEAEPFSKDGKNQPYRSFNRLEMIEHDQARPANVTSQMIFPDAKNPIRSPHNPEVAQVHPKVASCQGCHQGAMRMAPYAFWPGSAPTFFDFDRFGQREAFAKTFLVPHGKQGRYRHLNLEAFGGDASAAHGNISELNEIAMLNNAARLAREVSGRKDFPLYGHAIAAAAHGCGEFKKFLAGGVAEEFEKKKGAIGKELMERRAGAFRKKLDVVLKSFPHVKGAERVELIKSVARNVEVNGDFEIEGKRYRFEEGPSASELSKLVALAFMVEVKLGGDLYEWQTDPIRGTNQFTTPAGYGSGNHFRHIDPFFYRIFAAADPDFPVAEFSRSEPAPAYCAYLQARSAAAFAAAGDGGAPPDARRAARSPVATSFIQEHERETE